MFENENNISELIANHLRGTLSAEDEVVLFNWINASPVNYKLYLELSTEYTLLQDLNTFSSVNKNSVWLKTLNRLKNNRPIVETSPQKISIFYKYKFVAIAASLILVVGFIIYFNSINNKQPLNSASAQLEREIIPGKNSATLTLSSGKKIVLSDAVNGEISNETGVSISKTANGQLVYTLKAVEGAKNVNYNTLSTARGEQYQIILPDGTKVWLNAASSIIYPETFSSLAVRKVKLLGEAYFEVAKNKAKPFYVESLNQQVEVLGTHFNINCYNDENAIKTTLLEGSVKINGSTVLKPNEQAILSGNNISVIPVIAETFIDWKEGVFAFKQEDLYSIMRKISRWYDVEVVYQSNILNKQTYTGTISRSDHISKVLQVLTEIGGLKFSVKGNRILVIN